jgi:hypothetical protein
MAATDLLPVLGWRVGDRALRSCIEASSHPRSHFRKGAPGKYWHARHLTLEPPK